MLQSSLLVQSAGERNGSVIFEKSNRYLEGILSDDTSSDPYGSINLLGKPLVIHNIEKLTETYGDIRRLFLPTGASVLANKIAQVFPEIQIDEYNEIEKVSGEGDLKIPLDSLVVRSPEGGTAVSQITYPWDILKAMEYVLESEVKSTNISKDVSIESGSVVDGPCMIEPGVHIDNFCKIKGPVYIGQDCKIGTGSLVRNSMLGRGTIIGFSCEVARSYVAGYDTFPHYDAILDSVVGEHTWMGGYVAITNVMLNNKLVSYKIDGKLMDTGMDHFGAVIGHHSTIGAGVVILPGRYMPPGSFIPPHVLFSSIEHQEPAGAKMG
jgi:UDP-N-acetylglucosamine diphosphorylase / glucose-1-phosphate thymidylyltransferase / UDP-N-acetylgalactosamine diphosphorylase / glucosamine-1-phosphate N-acetyltransferase / galactosamine-1-phosphate N-acetyltransferase